MSQTYPWLRALLSTFLAHNWCSSRPIQDFPGPRSQQGTPCTPLIRWERKFHTGTHCSSGPPPLQRWIHTGTADTRSPHQGQVRKSPQGITDKPRCSRCGYTFQHRKTYTTSHSPGSTSHWGRECTPPRPSWKTCRLHTRCKPRSAGNSRGCRRCIQGPSCPGETTRSPGGMACTRPPRPCLPRSGTC